MKIRTIGIVAILVILITGCSKKPENDTLLRIGNQYYSILDFFETNSRDRFVKIPEKTKIKNVKKWAENQLLIESAKNKNYLENNEKIQEEIAKHKRNAKVKLYLDATIMDSLIPEKEIRKFYDKMGTEVNASHILIQHKGANPKSDRTKEAAKKLANEVYQKAVNGTNFTELVGKYSDDKTAGKDGNLGFFGAGKMVPPFEDSAFALGKDEISKPVETRFGYHIIKMIDKRKKPVKSYEEEKENIKNKLISKYRKQLNDAYMKKIESVKEKYNYTINDDVVKELLKKADVAKKSKGSKGMYNERKLLKEMTLEKPIGSCNGNDITIDAILEKMKTVTFRMPPQFLNQKYFNRVIELMYVTDLLLLEYENSGIKPDEQYKKDLETFKQRLIVREYKKDLFNENIDITNKEIKEYYEKNKDKRYATPPRMVVREIYQKDKSSAEKLLTEVMEKEDQFATISEKLTERNKGRDKPGYLGKITPAQYGDIGRIAAETPENTIHPDLIKVGEGWSIIKVYDKEEAGVKELSQVKPAIKRILTSKKRNKNRDKIMEQLKKENNYKIYWSSLNIDEK